MSVCNVTWNVRDISAALKPGAVFTFARTQIIGQDGFVIVNDPVSATSAIDGSGSIPLLPGNYQLVYTASNGRWTAEVTVFDEPTRNLADLIGNVHVELPPQILVSTEAARDTAVAAAGTATTQAGIATTGATNATTQAGIATTQASTATTQAGIATTQANIATAAAAVAGVFNSYPTRAAADAALASVPANATIIVSVDETRSSRPILYRKTGGVYVFERDLSAPLTVATKNDLPVGLFDGQNAVTEGQTWRWRSTTPVFIHQNDLASRKYDAPNAAAAGAWETTDPPTQLSAMDQAKVLMAQQRVDFVLISDSNTHHNGFGWSYGLHYALAEIAPMYGTGLVTMNEAGGSGNGVGADIYARGLIGATFAFTGAPASLDQRLFRGDPATGPVRPHSYSYRAEGASNLTNFTKGMSISGSAPVDMLGVNESLTGHAWIGGFTSGAGSVKLAWREGTSGTAAALGPAIPSNAVADGVMAKYSLVVPARSPSTSSRAFLFGFGASEPLVPPFFATYQYVENQSRTTGWRLSTLRGVGGESIREAAASIKAGADATLIHFLEALRDGQRNQARKAFYFVVNHGLNGRTSDAGIASEGPGARLPGNDRFAQVDNFVAIRNRIEALWVAQGWDVREIRWVYFVSHPVPAGNNDELMQEYDAQFATYFALNPSRGQLIRLRTLTTATEMSTNGWYVNFPTDTSHLSSTPTGGYRSLSRRIIDAML